MVQNRSRNNYNNQYQREPMRSCQCQNMPSENTVSATVACDALGTLAGYIKGMVPAMAYVPTQVWADIYCPEEGLERGTIFAALYKPFEGRQGGCCK